MEITSEQINWITQNNALDVVADSFVKIKGVTEPNKEYSIAGPVRTIDGVNMILQSRWLRHSDFYKDTK